MNIDNIKVLRGPNQWARFPVLEVRVDLGWLEEYPSHTLAGFNERLMNWLPTMIEHRCSIGERGGFFERLRTGTWMGHVLEHVTLELQSLAGTEVGYGRAHETKKHGVYNVIIEYKEEDFAVHCLHAAHSLLIAAIEGSHFDVGKTIESLREKLLLEQLGPSTRSIVEAARRRDIPVRRLSEGSLVRLGIGSKQRRIIAAETDQTSAVSETIAQDKELTRGLLEEAGIPVAKGKPVFSAEEAWQVATEIGLPVVIKPRCGNQGRGVSGGLTTQNEVSQAYSVAISEEEEIVVERCLAGDDYRLLVIGNELIAAARRCAPCITGDGSSTIEKLVQKENRNPCRCDDHAGSLSLLCLDAAAEVALCEQGFSKESIPNDGQLVLLRRNANLSTGGTAEDVTDLVHPDTVRLAIDAVRVVGLDIAGVDIMATRIDQPLSVQHGGVVEINACPGLRMHLEPTVGGSRDVGSAIISTLFETGEDGRIPVAAVTGTNGKTTVTRLLAHVASTGGATVGIACTEGVWVGDRQLDSGDCSGPASARRILAQPNVTTAVLETARGGILREGCGFDACDVAVVTNISSGDHLGLHEIDTPEQLAWVKGAIVAAVRTSGAAVLNAADPLVVDMKKWCQGRVIYFSLNPEFPVLTEHLASGGLGATIRDGWIVLCDGPRETRLANLDKVPLVHQGLVSFQVENALAASAAAWSMGVPLELVRLGLESFSSGALGSPGRFNMLELDGATVVVDYGHNVPSLEQVCLTLEKLPHAHRTAVYSAAGDRRNEDLLRQGELLGKTFDRIVIYEDAYRRGRSPGEITRLIAEGIVRTKQTKRRAIVESGGDWETSAATVLDAVKPGDLVLLQPDTIEQTMPWLMERYGNRLRGIGFDQIADVQSLNPNEVPFDPEHKKDRSSDL